MRVIAFTLLLTGCGVQVGPFVPYNAKVCSSDVQCKDGERCWFPGVDTRAVCMPGENSSVAVLPQ